MPKVELTNGAGRKLGEIVFEWAFEPGAFPVKDVRYEVEDPGLRNAIVDIVRDNPEGLSVYGGHMPDTLEGRLDGIYVALWWVRNGLGLDVAWKGPRLTPDPKLVY